MAETQFLISFWVAHYVLGGHFGLVTNCWKPSDGHNFVIYNQNWSYDSLN